MNPLAGLALLALVLLIGCWSEVHALGEHEVPEPTVRRARRAVRPRQVRMPAREHLLKRVANRYYGTSGTEVNYDLAVACMKARGWYPAQKK
jgi:hypothetical protein